MELRVSKQKLYDLIKPVFQLDRRSRSLSVAFEKFTNKISVWVPLVVLVLAPPGLAWMTGK
jgi:hypothetical protein